SLAPFTVVLVVAVSQLMQQLNWTPFSRRWNISTRTLGASDFLLCAAVLAYVAAHFRLQGLGRHIFPPDVRLRLLHRFTRSPRSRGAALAIERKRAVRLVTPGELVVLVLSLPLWVLLAQLAWHYLAQLRDVLARHHHYQEWDPWLMRLIVLLAALIAVL